MLTGAIPVASPNMSSLEQTCGPASCMHRGSKYGQSDEATASTATLRGTSSKVVPSEPCPPVSPKGFQPEMYGVEICDMQREGQKVMEDANHFSLSLLNLPHAYSHLEQAGRQADTTPGLIWTSRPKLCTWKVQEDSMGSDHFPVGVTVRTRGNKSERGAQKRLLRPALGSLQRYAQYTVSASECIRPGQAMTVVVCQKTIRIWTGICCVYGTAS